MTKKPAIPPANRSPKGPGSDPKVKIAEKNPAAREVNPHEQGDSANIEQNTTNQGGRRVSHH